MERCIGVDNSTFRIVALCGHPGSGKSTLARELESRFNFEIVSGSRILELAAVEQGVDLKSRGDYDSFHRLWRADHGEDAMARKVIELAKTNIPFQRVVCFENLRNRNDTLTLRSNGARIIALDCSLRERFRRTLNLSGNKCPKDLESFWEEEAQEYASDDPLGSHLLEVMQGAHFHLDASRSKEMVLAALQKYLEGFLLPF